MLWGLARWHGGHDLHFITFSCYRRQALLSNAHRRELFLKVPGAPAKRRYTQIPNLGCPVLAFFWLGRGQR